MKRSLFLNMSAVLLCASMTSAASDITFMSDGKVYETISVDQGKTIVMPKNNPRLEGFGMLEFAGWSTTPDGPVTLVDANTIVEGDMTLYAQWYRNKQTRLEWHKVTSADAASLEGKQFYVTSASGEWALSEKPVTVNGADTDANFCHVGARRDVLTNGEIGISNGKNKVKVLTYEADHSITYDGARKFTSIEYMDAESQRISDNLYMGYYFMNLSRMSYTRFDISVDEQGIATIACSDAVMTYSDTPATGKRYFNFVRNAQPNVQIYAADEVVTSCEYVSSSASYRVTIVPPFNCTVIGNQSELLDLNNGCIWSTDYSTDANGNRIESYRVLQGSSITFLAEALDMAEQRSFVWNTADDRYDNAFARSLKVTPVGDMTIEVTMQEDQSIISLERRTIPCFDNSLEFSDIKGDGSILVGNAKVILNNATVNTDIICDYNYTPFTLIVKGECTVNGNIKSSTGITIQTEDGADATQSKLILNGSIMNTSTVGAGGLLTVLVPTDITSRSPIFNSFEQCSFGNLEITDPYYGYFDAKSKCYYNENGSITYSGKIGILTEKPEEDEDEPETAVTVVAESNTDAAPAYNLSAQRVNSAYRGIIISGGKKYLNNAK